MLDELLAQLNGSLANNQEDRKRIEQEISALQRDAQALEHRADLIRARIQGIEEARAELDREREIDAMPIMQVKGRRLRRDIREMVSEWRKSWMIDHEGIIPDAEKIASDLGIRKSQVLSALAYLQANGDGNE